jgi:hypothetical protein
VALLSFPLIATVVLVVFSCAAHLAHASSRFLFPSPLLAEVVMVVVEWIASMVIFKSSPPTVTTKGLVGRVAGSRLVIVDFRDAVDVCVYRKVQFKKSGCSRGSNYIHLWNNQTCQATSYHARTFHFFIRAAKSTSVPR